MTFKIGLSSAALAFFFFGATNSLAANLTENLATADQFYQKGNCPAAVIAYKNIYYDPVATEDNRDLVIFRTSYCYMNMNQLDAAITGFQLVVNKYPHQDEARFRLAQCYAQNGRHLEARDEALRVKDPAFLLEAVLLVAQQDLELGEPELAINELSSVNVTKEAWPIFCYWLGVSHYHEGDSSKAEFYFALAMKKSPLNLWVYEESKNWLIVLRKEKTWAHGNVSFGYFVDGNVAQDSVLNTNGSGVPIETGPKSTSYFTDTGFLLSSGFSFRLVNEKKWNLFTNFSFSSPFYLYYINYNNQVYTGSISSSYKVSSFWSADLTAKYIDSRYKGAYYQDYISFLAGISGPISQRLSFRFEVPYTFYVDTNFSKSYGANMNARYALPFAAVFLGESYYRTTGDFASYGSSGGSAYLSSGSMFSNYETTATYFGATIPFLKKYHFTAQANSSVINYASEFVPLGTVQATYPRRVDQTWTFYSEVGGPIVDDVWFANLSFTFTINKSVGLQGIASNNTIVDYNYTRPYTLLTTTLAF